jgi:hypothetical protein
MTRWLTAAATIWLLGSSSAFAQMKGLGTIEVVGELKRRPLDVRLPPDPGIPTHGFQSPSMLLSREVGENAAIGFGMAKVYGRRATGDMRSGERTVRTRKPAVTFVLKF